MSHRHRVASDVDALAREGVCVEIFACISSYTVNAAPQCLIRGQTNLALQPDLHLLGTRERSGDGRQFVKALPIMPKHASYLIIIVIILMVSKFDLWKLKAKTKERRQQVDYYDSIHQLRSPQFTDRLLHPLELLIYVSDTA